MRGPYAGFIIGSAVWLIGILILIIAVEVMK